MAEWGGCESGFTGMAASSCLSAGCEGSLERKPGPQVAEKGRSRGTAEKANKQGFVWLQIGGSDGKPGLPCGRGEVGRWQAIAPGCSSLPGRRPGIGGATECGWASGAPARLSPSPATSLPDRSRRVCPPNLGGHHRRTGKLGTGPSSVRSHPTLVPIVAGRTLGKGISVYPELPAQLGLLGGQGWPLGAVGTLRGTGLCWRAWRPRPRPREPDVPRNRGGGARVGEVRAGRAGPAGAGAGRAVRLWARLQGRAARRRGGGRCSRLRGHFLSAPDTEGAARGEPELPELPVPAPRRPRPPPLTPTLHSQAPRPSSPTPRPPFPGPAPPPPTPGLPAARSGRSAHHPGPARRLRGRTSPAGRGGASGRPGREGPGVLRGTGAPPLR